MQCASNGATRKHVCVFVVTARARGLQSRTVQRRAFLNQRDYKGSTRDHKYLFHFIKKRISCAKSNKQVKVS